MPRPATAPTEAGFFERVSVGVNMQPTNQKLKLGEKQEEEELLLQLRLKKTQTPAGKETRECQISNFSDGCDCNSAADRAHASASALQLMDAFSDFAATPVKELEHDP